MTLQHINMGQVVTDYIVNGRGDGAFSVEGVSLRIIGIINVRQINIVVADVAALIPALHHHAVVGHGFIRVLGGKGRIYIRIFLHHINMGRKAVVLGKQIFQNAVLRVRLHNPVNGHILFQIVDHHLGIAGNGIQLSRADI